MKTYAYVNADGDIKGIGMIYFETGDLSPEVAVLVNDLGEDAGIKAYGDKVKQDPFLTTVVVDTDQFPGGNGFTYDKVFRNAFKRGGGNRIDIDLPKAKSITHDKRRAKRAGEFAPLDVQATIPAMSAQAESARQAIRDKYAAIQTEIDACSTTDDLKSIIVAEGL